MFYIFYCFKYFIKRNVKRYIIFANFISINNLILRRIFRSYLNVQTAMEHIPRGVANVLYKNLPTKYTNRLSMALECWNGMCRYLYVMASCKLLF